MYISRPISKRPKTGQKWTKNGHTSPQFFASTSESKWKIFDRRWPPTARNPNRPPRILLRKNRPLDALRKSQPPPAPRPTPPPPNPFFRIPQEKNRNPLPENNLGQKPPKGPKSITPVLVSTYDDFSSQTSKNCKIKKK